MGEIADGEIGSKTTELCEALYQSLLLVRQRTGCFVQRITYHGDLRAQFMKIAARANKVTSVMNALPFLKNIPPRAGNKANAKGSECQ